MTKVAVIIVTHNSESTINQTLGSLREEKVETIVVDNKSTDQTLLQLSQFNNIRLIKNSENLGFGTANNIGVKKSSGDHLLLLNPDASVEPDCILKLEQYLEEHRETAIVGPKLLNSDGSVQKEVANFPSLVSQILILLRLHRVFFFSRLVYPTIDYNQTQEVEHLMGAALLIRRAVFEEIGGFDEKFFLWFEETDLLKRIKDNGYKIVYYPGTSVTHLVGQSTKQLNFFKRQTIWNRSLLHYFQKHKTWLHILILLPFVLLSYPAAFISKLIKG